MMLTGNWNATRFAQKPIPQPTYNFSNVPKPPKDLKGSIIQKVDNRDDFQYCMAEMLLVCKEATRRNPIQMATGGAKPLSLEYLADRMDIDEPCFGYLVRTNESDDRKEDCNKNWNKGMLQGFITVTTFTNWQKSFVWDSLNETAYECDQGDLAISSGLRKWDVDGSLAKELQATVHRGDIWNEGIVWPRIAEISLLGGLGCGKAMVSLVIEDFECMNASGKANYDYIVLQATDNSIPFYESLGFVRVGAVMKEDKSTRNSRHKKHGGSNEDDGDKEEKFEIVSSKTTSYKIEKKTETISQIAKKLKLDPWDIVFLNQHRVDEEIFPSNIFFKGSFLDVPVKEGNNERPEKQKLTPIDISDIKWHIAKENETPRTIAKKYGVNCTDLVEANRGRHPELISSSRLKDGTRIKVSHFHIPDNEYRPYSHWSFPDDEFEDGEPSYMMVYKLNRRKGKAATYRPFRDSLAAVFGPYEKTNLVLSPELPRTTPSSVAQSVGKKKSIISKSKPPKPVSPNMPRGAYMLFLEEQRELAQDEIHGLSIGEMSKVLGDLWRDMPDEIRRNYEKMATKEREEYEQRKNKYERDCKKYYQAESISVDETETSQNPPSSACSTNHSLFNAVVRLRPGAMTECSEYKYWYVLTYIPDLKWCHLAPMIQVGVFGSDKPKVEGRPKWKLVDESLGKEVDISSMFCIPIKSKSMRKTLDADKEEWDIIDDGKDSTRHFTTSRHGLREAYDSDSFTRNSFDSKISLASKGKVHRTPAIKPSVERKRKLADVDKFPPLEAYIPGANKRVSVQLGLENMTNKKRVLSASRPVSKSNLAQPINIGDKITDNSTTTFDRPKEVVTMTVESLVQNEMEQHSVEEESTKKSSAVSSAACSETGLMKSPVKKASGRSSGDAYASPSRAKRVTLAFGMNESSSDPDESFSEPDTFYSEPNESSDDTIETMTSDSYTDGTLTSDETDTDSICEGVRRSSRSNIKARDAQASPPLRPRRSAAPVFLGESEGDPLDEKATPRKSNRTAPSPSFRLEKEASPIRSGSVRLSNPKVGGSSNKPVPQLPEMDETLSPAPSGLNTESPSMKLGEHQGRRRSGRHVTSSQETEEKLTPTRSDRKRNKSHLDQTASPSRAESMEKLTPRRPDRNAAPKHTQIEEKSPIRRSERTAPTKTVQGSSLSRPRRSAAPTFLGESPESSSTEGGSHSKRLRQPFPSSTAIQETITTPGNNILHSPLTRPRRKSAPSFYGDSLPRKPRTVNSVGSRRSVLQD